MLEIYDGRQRSWVERLAGRDSMLTFYYLQAVAQSGGRLNERRAYHLVSGALDALFGLEQGSAERDLLVFKNGSPFKTSAKLAAVISPAAGVVELL